MAITSRGPASGAIEKAIDALTDSLEIGEGADISVPDENVTTEGGVEITNLPDGGAEINTDPNAPIDQSQIPFNGNLANFIEDNDLQTLSNKLVAAYESDKMSRKDWEDTYVKGLDMLGFKYEDRTQPFEGVVHPLLAE